MRDLPETADNRDYFASRFVYHSVTGITRRVQPFRLNNIRNAFFDWEWEREGGGGKIARQTSFFRPSIISRTHCFIATRDEASGIQIINRRRSMGKASFDKLGFYYR